MHYKRSHQWSDTNGPEFHGQSCSVTTRLCCFSDPVSATFGRQLKEGDDEVKTDILNQNIDLETQLNDEHIENCDERDEELKIIALRWKPDRVEINGQFYILQEE